MPIRNVVLCSLWHVIYTIVTCTKRTLYHIVGSLMNSPEILLEFCDVLEYVLT
jgi:hypothetical protein